MNFVQGKFFITEKTAVAKQIYSFRIECPEVVKIASAGQFVHIKADGFLLRRPISICGLDREKGLLRIVFEVRGKGTDKLSQLNKGDFMDIIAPLGHGFTVNREYKKVVLIGGGIGTPPMLPLAEIYGDRATVITGFRNSGAVILQEDFGKTGAETVLCTDDGSAGVHGFVTEPLAEILEKNGADMVYACGPTPMLKKVSEICSEKNIPCEISLEERMACGVGACLGCACRIKKNGEEVFAHVCKDGPVFNAEEVLW